jgi:predicted RNase H-like HicB family nuclease
VDSGSPSGFTPSVQAFEETGESYGRRQTLQRRTTEDLEQYPQTGRAQVNYPVLYEKGPTSYGASVPDLPGCYAIGETLEDARALIAEAIAAHVKLLREDGEAVPGPSVLELVEVPLEPAV